VTSTAAVLLFFFHTAGVSAKLLGTPCKSPSLSAGIVKQPRDLAPIAALVAAWKWREAGFWGSGLYCACVASKLHISNRQPRILDGGHAAARQLPFLSACDSLTPTSNRSLTVLLAVVQRVQVERLSVAAPIELHRNVVGTEHTGREGVRSWRTAGRK